jgi:hypothetical protein
MDSNKFTGTDFSQNAFYFANSVDWFKAVGSSMARQIFDEPEPRYRTEFRTGCLALGLKGCWAVSVAKRRGPAKELIDEAKEAAVLLADIGILFEDED